MPDLYFEDFAVGTALPEAALTVSEEDASFFADAYGPGAPWPSEPRPSEPRPTEPRPTEPRPTEPRPTEPRPTEPRPGERGRSDAPLAGWHVAALGMRLLFDAFLGRTAGLGGPGVECVTWTRPVRVGDTLRFTARVASARASASRPEMGIVTLAISIFNQDSARVMTQENAVMVARRGGIRAEVAARRDGAEAQA